MTELSRLSFLFAPAWCCCVLGLGGCSDVDQIRRYTVERPLPKDRMLAAIIPQSDQAWFFKLSGPSQTLEQLSETFSAFIGTVRIPGTEPTWQLPSGWVRTAGSSMRFATIQISTDEGPLELSVTRLPMMADEAQLLLENINRWRGQLQLPAISAEVLPQESVQMELDAESGLTATLVDMVGNLQDGGAGAAPFASGGASPGGPFAGPSRSMAPQKTIEYETPEGWQPGERVVSRAGFSISRDAAFEVVDGEARAEITVTQLPASQESLRQNINRWRSQVQMDPNEGLPELEQIELGGVQGVSMELVGPRQAILGVIAIDQGTGWFVKLMGDHDLALRERERFQQFVASIQFKDEQ